MKSMCIKSSLTVTINSLNFKNTKMESVEIIDFFKPLEDAKNLYITNITITSKNSLILEDSVIDIKNKLLEIFSKFGLIYEVQVMNIDVSKSFVDIMKESKESYHTVNTSEENLNFYAFVKFYSSMSASKAKRSLHLTNFIGTGSCKVQFAKRKKSLEKDKQELYVTQCQDLANYYFGFNGWSSSVKHIKKESLKPNLDESEESCCFQCVVILHIHQYDLNITGLGISEARYAISSNTGKIEAFHRCKKRAYQYALQNAFSKVLLVVLSNGKVFAEINTNIMESQGELKLDNNYLTVNELEEEPKEESGPEDIDTLNVDILSELQQDAS
ncbi:RAD52 motif-containing protein 1-like [Physella acuta]|uniref:RAD52 motif-containing protein 1-like n=1 Tax=Physella acuta TaxID=109671 RepID=UPI0027DCB3F3|nr:RAD52 motif-containing protein 1-like [Physella acuta]XP_059158009.1 RAD52 motif-containing protein 1-like [Physella acuta]XP_059158010.1 RAD52 motif-containing protein 1-like [Physella acuta]